MNGYIRSLVASYRSIVFGIYAWIFKGTKKAVNELVAQLLQIDWWFHYTTNFRAKDD